ncbi:DUF1648 domain-containing protein [Spirosoma sp. KCTC 42546]|uniref:DUF1648 domain-containing protein n=1 Tax=Spirosoma sp. KCTC 42546 TaxID=2520506 RepID=UPI001159CF47|nr:DUF1648 domain-containing protein [Spirosoma sp. KCTC 42546]QDK77896.1 DUF1648 domain-containing protein [Spirosoma sp. KCTC 42546]
MSSFERNANRLTILLLFTLVGISITGSIWLTGPIPTHFNGNGQADHFGSPDTLLLLPILCLCMVGILWAIRYTPTELMNFPGPRTPEHIASQRQNFDQLVATIRVLVTGLFLCIAGQISWASAYHQKQVSLWPSFLFIALFFISTLMSLVRAYRLSVSNK